ncbi:MAG: hypothetical protein ABH834_03190 [Candidatus Altiarchaeota archaeon]
MLSRGQAAVEWLITHGWSILIVLSVGILLFHLGVFEAEAVPRFEGLRAAGVQPVSDQVHLYSDGVLVLTVLNTRPYTMEVVWVEVSPVGDEGDVARTDLNAILKAGELAVFEVNASNIYTVSGASLSLAFAASAASSTVDFNLCLNEVHSGGGQLTSHTVCGKALKIPVVELPEGSGGCPPGHDLPSYPCILNSDCPLSCQICVMDICESWSMCAAITDATGILHKCQCTVAHPEGECVPA